MTTVAGLAVAVLDGGWATTADAEHATLDRVASLGGPAVSACTHLTGGRFVVTVLGGPAEPPGPELAAAVEAHRRGTAGRAFLFPGAEVLTGVLTVGDVLRLSAIDVVSVVGSGPAAPDAELDTQAFVRPVWGAGRLGLVTRPGPAGRLVPFEQRRQIPCCTVHVPD